MDRAQEEWDRLDKEEANFIRKYPQLEPLFKDDAICLGYDHDGEETEDKLAIPINDTFAYATADCELFEESDIPEILNIYNAHGWIGLICWVANKIDEDPVIEYTEDPLYQEIWKAIYGDKKLKPNYCNTGTPRWSKDKLDLKP
jgi:hypothetical protein